MLQTHFLGAHKIIQHIGRHRKSWSQLPVLIGQVVLVQAVKINALVPGLRQQVRPVVVHQMAIGCRHLHHHHPGPPAGKVHAAQHVLFEPFHVDLQKMHLFGRKLGQYAIQASHRHLADAQQHAVGPVRLRHICVDGCPAAHRGVIEFNFTLMRTRRHAQIDIARTLRLQGFEVPGQRLDVYTRPAPLIQTAGDRIVRRVVGAHIHVKTVLNMPEHTPQHHIFMVLRIRNKSHTA